MLQKRYNYLSMLNTQVYREVKDWKKPLHASRVKIAKAYLKFLSGTQIVGITGSVGKTLTQNVVKSVLSQKYNTAAGNENLDPTFRIPKSILKTKKWDKFLILEYGVEHPGDMDYYLSIAKPKIAIITSVAPTHTRYFQNAQGVYSEKVKLAKSLNKSDTLLLNADDELVAQMAKHTKAQVVWFGKNVKNGLKISHFSQSLKGAQFRLHSNGQMETVNWKIIGNHQLLSAYIGATLGLNQNLTLKQIAKGLSMAKPPSRRLNLKINKDVNILDDTYNSSPKAALESTKTLIELGKGLKKIAVFGEMKDLGRISEEEHKKLGEKIAKTNINILVTVGKIAGQIGASAKKNGFRGEIYSAKNTKEATGFIEKDANKKSLVLVKGSRHSHLERVVLGLLKKSTRISCYHCGELK